jgi:density-regulated protein DRP1
VQCPVTNPPSFPRATSPSTVLSNLNNAAGVPPEFNEFLPKDSEEFKRWKAAKEGGTLEQPMAQLALADSAGDGSKSVRFADEVGVGVPATAAAAETTAASDASSAAAPAPPSALKAPDKEKKSKKGKGPQQVVLSRSTRSGKKSVTTITGLDAYGIKLNEAAKLFGKKFASGSSVVKNAEGKEQIDVQGDCVDGAVELILKLYGKDVKKSDIYHVENKKKERYFDEEDVVES